MQVANNKYMDFRGLAEMIRSSAFFKFVRDLIGKQLIVIGLFLIGNSSCSKNHSGPTNFTCSCNSSLYGVVGTGSYTNYTITAPNRANALTKCNSYDSLYYNPNRQLQTCNLE